MGPSYSSLDLVLLGPPGAGKGTQALTLGEVYAVPHLATGDLLREEARSGSPLGAEIGRAVEHGELVPDRLVAGLLLKRLDRETCERGFLLDGFPRTVEQARILDDLLAELGRRVERALFLDADEAVLVGRLAGRAGADEVRAQVAAWRRTTLPVVDLYDQRGILVRIDANGPRDQVAAAVLAAVGTPVGA